MTVYDLRVGLDLAYLLAVGAATLFLAYQGARRAPAARLPALAMGILLLQAFFRLSSGAVLGALGLAGRPALVPVLDRTLGTLFLILLVYGLVRPLFPVYRAPLVWLLVSHLGFLVVLSSLVWLDFGQRAGPGVRFADHWGALGYELYQTPLLLAALGALFYVWRATRSTYAGLLLGALGLWTVGHVVHLAGLLTGADEPITWGSAFRVFEIMGVALIVWAIVAPDAARRTLAARYLEDADAVVRRLQAEVQRLVAAQAALEERERLARELHDSVSQALFSIELNAGAIEALIDKNPTKARERLARLRAAAHEALGDLRSLIAELRPPALEGKPLAQALADYVAVIQEREGVSVTLKSQVAGDLDREAEVELFRIGYEALTNVVKHAEADQAWVDLEVHPPAFRLRVADNGRGFGVNGERDATARTFGLSGMRERAALLGARLTVTSQPGAGTEVVVER